MSNYEPNTDLSLSICNNELNLGLIILDQSSFKSPLPSSQPSRNNYASKPRIYSCNYCRKKFYSSQALGGHQNAHRFERTLAKKSQELCSALRPHSGGSSHRSSSGPSISCNRGQLSQPYGIASEHQHQHHGCGGFGWRRDKQIQMDYESRMESHQCRNDKGGQKPEIVQEDSNQIDLSLRL